MKAKKKNGRAVLCNRKGGAVVDYIMLTAVIAGVALPLLFRRFGNPIMENFQSNRQQMVSFIAQDRRQPVPNAWFGRETPADENPSDLEEPSRLKSGDLAEPTPLAEPGQVGSSPLAAPGQLQTGELATPSDLPEPSSLSAGGNIGVGNTGGGGQGGNTSGGAGSSGKGTGLNNTPSFGNAQTSTGLSDSFFDAQGNNVAGKAPPKTGDEIAYGADGDAGGRLAQGSGTIGGTEEAVRNLTDNNKQKKEGALAKKRRDTVTLAQLEDEIEKKEGEIDWWALIKILLVLLIIVFLVIIGLNSLKRTSN